jgi:hypothetical protein
MTRLGRYWLFFVIVAVGLALSWGQVGRKTERALSEDPVFFLSTEADCLVSRLPCAAVAGDRALVLGPATGGLRLEQTGFDAAAISMVEARLLTEQGDGPPARSLLRDAGGWRLPLAADALGVVRIRVVERDRVSVADYRLR